MPMLADIFLMNVYVGSYQIKLGKYFLLLASLYFDSILMTNQLQFLESSDNVILLSEGEIVAQGRYEELKEKGFEYYLIYFYFFLELIFQIIY
jgi:hypothetical protein